MGCHMGLAQGPAALLHLSHILDHTGKRSADGEVLLGACLEGI